MVWSTIVNYQRTPIDNDFYADNNNTSSPENHAMVETADGSIYVATSSNSGANAVPGADWLYRLDANGNLQFSKVYTQPAPGTIHPVQLIADGANNLLMADQVMGGNAVGRKYGNLQGISGQWPKYRRARDQ